MLWPVLAVLAAGAAIALHLWRRSKFLAAERRAQNRIAALEQSQREAALTIQTRQETLFNSMAEGLLLLDQAGRIELANRAFVSMFGVTNDLRGRTLIEALRLHELADLVEFLGSQKQVLNYELKLMRPTERCLEVNGAVIFSPAGQRQGTILVCHDLTRIRKLERARQEFVANVSHELRTPLSLIKGYVETLLEGAKDDPQVASKFLQTIDRNAERLNLLIQDLLTISELESGRMKLDLRPVSLNEVAQKVLTDFAEKATARKVRLNGDLGQFQVLADSNRLEQVFGNLVDNAIKYGRPEGAVTLAARPLEDSYIEVSVADDGPGIPPESIDRVFERFYRVDKARSREQGGTGLGLSIVKHIIQSHGGRVWANSEPGHGATFFFTLPQPPNVAHPLPALGDGAEND